jgi:hypothetical protein
LRKKAAAEGPFFDWFAIRANQRLGAASESEMLRQRLGVIFSASKLYSQFSLANHFA